MADDALIQEVNDDVRREKMQRLWQHVRMPLFVAVALLVGTTAGFSIYKHYETKAQQESTQAFLDAIQLYNEANFEGAIEGFKTASKVTDGELGDLTALWQGKSQLALEDQDAAIASFTGVASNEQAIDRVRDLACIHLFALSTNTLPDYCVGAHPSPLRAGLKLLHAAHLWQTGRVDEARNTLQTIINDADASNEMRATANRYLTTITAEQEK